MRYFEKVAGFKPESIVAAARNRLATIANLKWAPTDVQTLAKGKTLRQLEEVSKGIKFKRLSSNMPMGKLTQIAKENAHTEFALNDLRDIASQLKPREIPY